MKISTWNRASTEDDVRREEEQYAEMMRNAPNDCYVILPGEIVHAAEPGALLEILAGRGIRRDEVLIMRAPGPGPYVLHGHLRLI